VHPLKRGTCSCNRRPSYDIVCSPSLDYFSINRYYGKNDLTINAVNACEQRMSRIQEKFIVKFTKLWT
jgi:hypothetical protein